MKMKYTNYRRGGFFGNSQDKFSDMEEAGKGINIAYKGMGPFAGKGNALRREKRYLKKLERQGKLNEEGPQSADRLDYLKKVQRDRIKKGVGAAALAAGAAAGGAALAAKGGLSGISGIGGKGAIKTGLGNLKTAVGNSKLGTFAKDLKRGLGNMPKGKAPEVIKKMAVNKLEGGADGLDKGLKLPDINPGLVRALQAGLNDPDMQPGEENINDNLRFDKAGLPLVDPLGGGSLMDVDLGGGSLMNRVALGDYGFGGQRQSDRSLPDNPDMRNLFRFLQNYRSGEKGMKILKGGQKKLDKNNDGQITGEDFKLLQAMKAMYGAKLPR